MALTAQFEWHAILIFIGSSAYNNSSSERSRHLKCSSKMCRKASRNTFSTHIWKNIQQIQQNTTEALKKIQMIILEIITSTYYLQQYLIIYIIICAPGIHITERPDIEWLVW